MNGATRRRSACELLVADRLLAGAEAVEVVLVVAEVAGQDEVEQVLELVQRVLDRRAGEAELHLGVERDGGLLRLRLAVLDPLHLVEHGDRPRHRA